MCACPDILRENHDGACRQEGEGGGQERRHQEVLLLCLVPGGQGVQGAQGRGVHQPCGEAPGGQGEGTAAHQGDAAAQQQGTQDHPERFGEASAGKLQGKGSIVRIITVFFHSLTYRTLLASSCVSIIHNNVTQSKARLFSSHQFLSSAQLQPHCCWLEYKSLNVL